MFRAWIIWILSSFFMFYKYVIEVCPSVMAKDLMREFSLSGVEMGNFAACYFYAYLLLQIPAGLLIDRWGPRTVTTVAIFLCAAGAYLFAVADSFFLANTGRFISGIGAAFAVVNCLKLIANWFPAHKFALMAGLMMSVGMLGAMGGQAPLALLLAHLGWRRAMEAMGLIGFLLAILFFFVVRNKKDKHHKERDLIAKREGIFTSLKKVLGGSQSWFLSLYSGFAFAPVMAFGGLWGVPFLEEAYGFSQHIAAQGTTLIFLGFACGAPFFGWFSDRIGKRRPVMFWGTLIASTCLIAVIYFPWIGNLSLPLLFLFGFFISAFMLCFTMIKESYPIYLAATSIGFMNAFDAFCGALSDPLTGKILDYWWVETVVQGVRTFPLFAYHYSFLILVAYFILALLFLKPIRETHCKQVYPAGLP